MCGGSCAQVCHKRTALRVSVASPLARQLRKFGRIALVSMASLLASSSAAVLAEERPAGFVIDEWKVPASCGERAAFEELVREAIGDWPEGLAPVHVGVRIANERRRTTLVLSTTAPSGEGRRELAARNCEELLATAAVVLSLALDSEALYDNELEHEVQTSEERAPAPKAAYSVSMGQIRDSENPEVRSRDKEKLAKEREASEDLDTSVHLLALSEVGTLPRTAFGLGVLASAYSGPYRVSFRLMKWADQVQYVGTAGDRGGNFELLSGSLQVCRELPHNRKLPWGACLQGTLARMSAAGIVEFPADAVNLLASAGAGVFVNLPFRILLHAESSAHIVRPRYSLEIHEDPTDVERMEVEVHQPAFVAVRLGLSWGMSF